MHALCRDLCFSMQSDLFSKEQWTCNLLLASRSTEEYEQLFAKLEKRLRRTRTSPKRFFEKCLAELSAEEHRAHELELNRNTIQYFASRINDIHGKLKTSEDHVWTTGIPKTEQSNQLLSKFIKASVLQNTSL